jgi:hypothetical protein
MRPARFEGILKELLQQSGGQVKQVETVREAGYDRHPYGLVVTYRTGARALLQIVVTSAEADKFSEPEQIVEGGTPPAPVEVPDLFDGGKVRLANVDRHLTALVLNSGSREVVSAEAFSARETPSSVRYGAKITFHDTSRIYVYVVHALPAGRDDWPRGGEFDVPAAV